MPRPVARPIVPILSLALAALAAPAAHGQSARASITISATVAAVSAAPDAGLLSPQLTMSTDGGAAAGGRLATMRMIAAPASAAPKVDHSQPARYRVTVQLTDSMASAGVLVRNAAGVEQRVADGREVVVADSVTAAEALRAPVHVRVGPGGAADGTVHLRYVVTPMESLTR